MKSLETTIRSSIICLISVGFIFCPSSSKAYEEKNKLGIFENKDFQKIIEKPFYLFGLNKDKAIPFYLKDFVNWEQEIIYNKNYSSEIEDPFMENGENFTENLCLELLESFEDKLHYQKISNVFIKENETKNFLQSISKDINQDPTDAKFKMKDNHLSILTKSQNGANLKIEESFEKIKNSVTENPEISYIPLEIDKIKPEISSDNPQQYQIKTLIGIGESDFSGSSQTRIHNIENASKKFNGVLIKPDEEFSFTENLGEVTEKTGYKEELVIKKNKTVPEYGGGICQLSTTFFRAALNTGLKITERHNHSYPVHYYTPIGSDATVYVPKPDLKIKNNTGEYILVQTRIDEKNRDFFVEFYSKEKLFDVEIIGPKITERTAEGKIRTALTQVVKNKKTGQEIFQDLFKSFYDSPSNYPSPNQIILEKPDDWSNRQWNEYYAKFGAIIENLKNTQ